LNPAVSFLLSSLISLWSKIPLKFCRNMFYLLSHACLISINNKCKSRFNFINCFVAYILT
jgi:hypothetical protein